MNFLKKRWKEIGLTALGTLIVIPGFFAFIFSFSCIVTDTSNDWIGFWGSYIGAIVGALVTAWGVSQTIKAGKIAEVSPYLAFEEVNDKKLIIGKKIWGHILDASGTNPCEKIIKITNVGNGPAKDIKIQGKGKWLTIIPLIKKDESVYVALEYFVDLLPNQDSIKSYTKEEILQYCGQSADVGIEVSCEDIMDNESKYELQVKIQCSIGIDTISSECRCKPNLYVTGWKMKGN